VVACDSPLKYINTVTEYLQETQRLPWDYLGLMADTGEANMALDRFLFEQLQAGGRNRPIVRLYSWERPTISLGKNQVVDEVIKRGTASRLGYDTARRPTGGRALLHKGDICYLIAAHKDHHSLFHSLTSTYRAIGTTLADMLRSLGIDLTDLPTSGTEPRKSLNPCFAMLSPFEVTVAGRKICGSAQFRSGGFFLQHGSIRVRDNWNSDDLTKIWPMGYELDAGKVTSVDYERSQITAFSEIEAGFLKALERHFCISIIRA
jgi:lipoyl(octanoyl) transferase